MQAVGRFVALGAFVALTTQARAQTAGAGAGAGALPRKPAPARTQTAITPADLMSRLYLYSDDSMMGRLAGSEYNLKATAYIASEAKRFGLLPAGDSGGFFQNVPLVKRQLDPSAGLSVDGAALRPWDDFVPREFTVAEMRPRMSTACLIISAENRTSLFFSNGSAPPRGQIAAAVSGAIAGT